MLGILQCKEPPRTELNEKLVFSFNTGLSISLLGKPGGFVILSTARFGFVTFLTVFLKLRLLICVCLFLYGFGIGSLICTTTAISKLWLEKRKQS